MVTFTSTLIDIERARLDRYRPVLSLTPEPDARRIVEPRTASPVFPMVMGELCPVAGGANVFVACEKSPMSWHQVTDHNTTVLGFAGFADDIQNRVGPPPPRRPSV